MKKERRKNLQGGYALGIVRRSVRSFSISSAGNVCQSSRLTSRRVFWLPVHPTRRPSRIEIQWLVSAFVPVTAAGPLPVWTIRPHGIPHYASRHLKYCRYSTEAFEGQVLSSECVDRSGTAMHVGRREAKNESKIHDSFRATTGSSNVHPLVLCTSFTSRRH